MQRMMLIAIPILISTGASFGQAPWTETFDNGFGRFTNTNGQGDVNFLYDATNQNIDATFVRRNGTHPQDTDLRVATVNPLNQNDTFGFSLEWNPVGISHGVDHIPLLGFFNEATLGATLSLKVVNTNTGRRYYDLLLPGVPLSTIGQIPDWSFGETYLLELLYNGTDNVIEFSSSILRNGNYIHEGTIVFPVAGVSAFDVSLLGMSNVVTPDFGVPSKSFYSTIDNFSFVPEPSTALLLTVSLLALRRRRTSHRTMRP